jgi:release factor glutamine methyltransferase
MNINFSWENSISLYNDLENKKNSLPIFYNYYNISNDFQNVYEPAEDTFLLIDSILNDINLLKKNNYFIKNKDINSIEIGCGNGLISCCYLNLLKELNITINNHFCVDINKDAVNLTKKLINNYNLNNNTFFIESDLFNNKLLSNKLFNIIIFNPPYVTTDDLEYQKALKNKDIYASWAGGKNGSETIFKFIEQINNYINKNNGIIYLLLSKENEYENIIKIIFENLGFKFDVLMKRKAVNEKLAVFKFYNKN